LEACPYLLYCLIFKGNFINVKIENVTKPFQSQLTYASRFNRRWKLVLVSHVSLDGWEGRGTRKSKHDGSKSFEGTFQSCGGVVDLCLKYLILYSLEWSIPGMANALPVDHFWPANHFWPADHFCLQTRLKWP
jgi:hypothetical protein